MRCFRLLAVAFVSLMLCWSARVRAQATDFPITVSDGTLSGTKVLHFGIDPAATNGIDAAVGETELPPVPPAGIFDVRFIGTDIGINLGQGLARDYRPGTATTTVTHIHELAYQPGTGTIIIISWNLPNWVTGILEDLFGGLLVKKPMSGNDSLVVANPGILSKLKMTVTYSPAARPNAPSNLAALAKSATEVELLWRDNSDNEKGFRIERKIGMGSFATLDTIAENLTTYSDLSLEEGEGYAYRIFAFSESGESESSNEAAISTPLVAPTECSATAQCLNEIVIQWRDNSSKEFGYKLLRSPTGAEDSFAEIGTTDADQISYKDSGLNTGATYYYRVFAYNATAQSGYAAASATTAGVTWSSVMRLNDACGELHELLFGQATGASDGIDAQWCEYELPPPPPLGISDARFSLPVVPVAQSLVDLRSDVQTYADWFLQFQTGPCGYPIELEWENSGLPEGSFWLKDAVTGTLVNVDMKAANHYTLRHTGIDRLLIQYAMAVSETMAVHQGWNIISVPTLAAGMSPDHLFPTATSFAFGYEGGYSRATTLENGCGYWLKFDSPEILAISGVAIRTTDIPVAAGWNLIGPYDWDLAVDDITSAPSGIIKSSFFTFEGRYRQVDSLMSGQGYWVKVKEAGVLHLAPGGRPEAGAPSSLSVKTDSMKPNRVPLVDLVLTVSDGAGGTQQLNFGLDTTATAGIDTALGEKELPPAPPTGVFEVRFIGADIGIALGQGSYSDYRTGSAGFVGTQTHELSYQVGAGTAITISWDLPMGVEGVLQDLFGGILVNQNMKDKGSYVVTNPGVLNKLKMIITYSGPVVLPPVPPLLESPLDGETGLATSLTLKWHASTEATSYQLQVSTEPTCATTVKQDTGLAQTSYQLEGLLSNTIYYWRVCAANVAGRSEWSSIWHFATLTTAVEERLEAKPATYSLSANYPNPLRPSGLSPATTIGYVLPEAAEIRIEVFDLLGTRVRTLINGRQSAGRHSVLWDGTDDVGRDLASGIYFYRLEVPGRNRQGFSATQRMNLVR